MREFDPVPIRATAEPPLRLISLKRAAEMLDVSVKWLRVHRSELPFLRELRPRVWKCDEAAMVRWVGRQRP